MYIFCIPHFFPSHKVYRNVVKKTRRKCIRQLNGQLKDRLIEKCMIFNLKANKLIVKYSKKLLQRSTTTRKQPNIPARKI